MKRFHFVLTVVLALFASCSNNDEPEAEVYYQVAEIANGSTSSWNMTYDEYGRVVKYIASYPDEIVNVTYSYPAEDKIVVHTEDRISSPFGGDDIVREYDDVIYLENGRVAYCEGVFTSNETGASPFKKKYRHEFTYTRDNYLNVLKWTEWNERGDDWAYDRPLTWENYYIWENGNLVEVQDYLGKNKPEFIYKYSYYSTTGVQNLVRVHFGRYQYYPLQLKGYFGLMSKNLVSTIEMEQSGHVTYITDYAYEVEQGRISSYTETRKGVSEVFNVAWTSGR